MGCEGLETRCAPGQKNPCPEDRNNPNKSPSELPRINKSNLAPKSDFPWLQGQGLIELANETLLTNLSGCPGDSGGGLTATYKGEVLLCWARNFNWHEFLCLRGN